MGTSSESHSYRTTTQAPRITCPNLLERWTHEKNFTNVNDCWAQDALGNSISPICKARVVLVVPAICRTADACEMSAANLIRRISKVNPGCEPQPWHTHCVCHYVCTTCTSQLRLIQLRFIWNWVNWETPPPTAVAVPVQITARFTFPPLLIPQYPSNSANSALPY